MCIETLLNKKKTRKRKREQFKSSIKLHQFITGWFMALINDNKLIKQTTLCCIPKNYIVLCVSVIAETAATKPVKPYKMQYIRDVCVHATIKYTKPIIFQL